MRTISRADGFTVVELLAALTLIVVAIVPLTSVIWSSFKVAGSTNHRTDAFSIAGREIEGLRADPYSLIGFYTDQSAPAWKNTTTVILGPCSTTCSTPFAPLVLPAGTSVVAGVTYSIQRYLYWADADGITNSSTSTTFSQAYKGATVTVSWTDLAGQHTIEQDSVLYPGGLGLYSGPGGSSSTTSTSVALSAPGAPTLAISASQPPSPQNQQEVDLSITAATSGGAVADYVVQWSTDPLFGAPSQSPQLPASSMSFAAQGLAAQTTYYFRSFAANSAGQSPYSNTVSAATAATPSTTTTAAATTTLPATTTTTLPCQLGAFTITTTTPGKTYLTNKGAMSENLGLSVAVNGTCTASATVTSVLSGTTAPDPLSPYALSGPQSGGQWTAIVQSSGQTNWTVGLHVMNVLLNGTNAKTTQGLLVCAWTPPGQRSGLSTTC